MPRSSSIPDEMTPSETTLSYWLVLLSLADQAGRDWLTGLHNRRYFEETLTEHLAAARRYERPLAVALFDLDNLKAVNDRRGHSAGDELIRNFGAFLKAACREADIVCRYGGDEFAVLLPETSQEEARHFAKRICRASDIPVTAGIAAQPSDDLVLAADIDLKAQKKSRQ